MTALVGFDPSKNRLGWGAVDLDTGAAVAWGVEALDVDGGGWLEHQARRAVTHVATRIALEHATEPAVWVREEPATRFVRVAKDHGAVCAHVDAAARSQWPWAPFWTILPTEWRTAVGLRGNASKADVAGWAFDFAGCDVGGQDAADGLAVARAGWVQWTTMERTTP